MKEGRGKTATGELGFGKYCGGERKGIGVCRGRDNRRREWVVVEKRRSVCVWRSRGEKEKEEEPRFVVWWWGGGGVRAVGIGNSAKE